MDTMQKMVEIEQYLIDNNIMITTNLKANETVCRMLSGNGIYELMETNKELFDTIARGMRNCYFDGETDGYWRMKEAVQSKLSEGIDAIEEICIYGTDII